MAKSKDDDIRSLLETNRIPKYCWNYTLTAYGYPDLRSYVLSRRFLNETKPIYIYPNKPSASERATFVSLLLAKELTLTGFSTHVLTIMDLVRIFDNDISDARADAIARAEALLIRDFYTQWDNALKNPLGDNLFKAEHVLKGYMEDETPVFFHAENPPAGATRWWTQSMVQKILESCEVYPIDL